MSRGKIAVLLLTILILNLCAGAYGCTSQGPQEQQRPAERQSSAQEDTEEPALETPEKSMEETANEERTQ
jgi:hypothetical protein